MLGKVQFELPRCTALTSCRPGSVFGLTSKFALFLAILGLLNQVLGNLPSVLAQQPQLQLLPRQTVGDSFLEEKLEQRGDLTLRKTSLPEALFAIGEIWGLNLVVGEEIQGQVNCDFKNAPLSEILNTVLLSNGYSYRPFGRSLVITRLSEMGDINPLFETATIPIENGNPLDLVEGASVFNSPTGKTKAIPAARSLLVVDYPDRVAMIRQFIQGLNNQAGQQVAGPEAGMLETLQLCPQYVPALMLKDAIAAAISAEGKVVVVEGENKIVVVDRPYYLRLAQQVLVDVDRPRPQVRITAYIYDVSLHDFETLGFNWSHALHGRPDADGNAQSLWAIDTITKVPIDGGAVSGAMTFMNMSNSFDLEAVITALNTAKDSRLLADPNVVVANNEDASVAIISEIPFQQLTQTQQGGNIGTTAFREAGVKLSVIPRIAIDGTISMIIEPEFSRLTGFTPESNQPIIDRRTAKTTVRVANGQTIVIGGLRQRTDVGTFNGIPYLKDVPYLGVLFRARETDVRESELIVLVKPEIVSYADLLNEREAAALGVTNKYLDQIPIGQAPVTPLPEVNCPPGQLEDGPQYEEVPAPLGTQKKTPATVESSSPGLALASQRGLRTHNPDSRPTWQTSTGGTDSLNSPSLDAATATQRMPSAVNSAPQFQRLPPVQSQSATQSVPREPITPYSPPVTERYTAPTSRKAITTPSPAPVATPTSAPAPNISPEIVPAETSGGSAVRFIAPPADETTYRTRGYRVNGPDEVRSASWINNVFRY